MQTNDVETAERIEWLQSAIPELEQLGNLLADQHSRWNANLETASADLGRLGEQIASQRANKQAALKNFTDDNPKLQRLQDLLATERARLAQFNLFQELNLWWQEDIHSRVLTWLLGPKNNHGIGDYFLKNFLAQLDLPDCIGKAGDWSKSESQREWYCVVDGGGGWLDILVTNDDAKFACAIENKVFSPEAGRQLTHYRKALETEYPDPNFTKCYVFLSPRGMESQWEDERGHWKPMNYTTILQLVEQAIEDKRAAMNKDVRSFLRQYVAMLRRKIVPDNSELQRLARKMYLEHREAVDLLKEHEPDWNAETAQIFKEAIAKQGGWLLDLSNNSFMRFRSVEWDRFECFQSGTGWAPGSNALLLFQFRFNGDGIPYLGLGISPGDESNDAIRVRIFEAVRQNPQWFRLIHSSLPAGWGILHQEPDCILDDCDYGVAWDDGTTRAKIEAWVEKFAHEQFPAMNEVIVNCLREYEAEAKGQ